jgi:hypothetical protein
LNLELSYLDTWLICGQRALRVRRRGIRLEQPGEEKRGGRNALRSAEPATSGDAPQHGRKTSQPQNFPI